ncbi:MAG: hypothetical protein HOQ05_13770 [Corynebacteriales bacterium]|nr:hypothetical protein [Mycobacteriales bacterium]
MLGSARVKIAVGLALVGLALTSCSDSSKEGLIIEKYPVNVVHAKGIGSLRFGDDRGELVDDERVYKGELACGGLEPYDIPGIAEHADIFFDSEDKFSVVWIFSPRVTTAEKLTVGSSIDDVRRQYPHAQELPEVGHSFPGVLVEEGDTGLLFLYEPQTGEVSKFLAGFVTSLRAVQHGAMDC